MGARGIAVLAGRCLDSRSVFAFLSQRCPRARSAMRSCRGFALGSRPASRSCRGFVLGSRPVFAFLSRRCPLARPASRFYWSVLPSVHACLCGSVAVFCPRFTPGIAVLSRCLSPIYPCLCGAIEAISSARVWLYGSIGAFCFGSRLLFVLRQTGRLAVLSHVLPSFMPGSAVLSRCFAVGSRRGLRFCRGVLPSVHAGACGSIAVFCRRSRLLFAAWRQTGRLAMPCVPIPPGRDRLRAFSRRFSVICLSGFTSGLCVYLWRSRRVTGETRYGVRGYGAGGAAFVRFYAATSAL